MRRVALVLGLCLAAAPVFAQNQGQLSQLPAMTGPLGGLVVECVSGCGSGGVGASVDISSLGGVVLPPGGPIPVNFTNTSLAVTNTGTFAVQAAQAGTWNIGSVTTLPAITFASPQAVTQSGVWNIGALTSITNPVAVTGTFFQATQPVSGTFWQATQPVSGTFFQATQPVSIASMPSTPVTGTFFQATQPVSAVALPLAANAAQETGGNLATLSVKDFATSAKQDIENVALAALTAALVLLGGSPTTQTSALQTLALPVSPGLPKFPCNAVRRTNCQPKGF